jgi:hypothetical protein
MPRAHHWQFDPYFRTKASGIATEEECQCRSRTLAHDAVDQNRRHHHEQRLQPINSGQRQHLLKDCRQANQHQKQFKKVCQTTLINKLIDEPETIAPTTPGETAR